MQKQNVSSLVIGMALFAMFFGSGNLIYPLFLGHVAEGEWPFASMGFILTAVILPLAGIFAMVVYKGDYGAFFSSLGKGTGFFVTLLLLSVWIPLGAGPRCVALAHASMLPYQTDPISIWVFSALYSIAVSVLVFRKSRILSIMGNVLTPFLLFFLTLILIKGIAISSLGNISFSSNSFSFFSHGLTEGYNTMDLIASFFFSASIIDILRKSSVSDSVTLTKTLKGSFFAAGLLAIIYIGLICLATSHEQPLHNIPKEQLLVHIAKGVLGPQLGIFASLAIFLACFTTSVALATVFADFIAVRIFKNVKQYHLGLAITQILVYAMSITGLQGITFVTAPILQWFYPVLILLIAYNLGRYYYAKKSQSECTVEKAITDMST